MIVMIPLIVNPSTAGGASNVRIKGSDHLSYLVDLIHLDALLLSYLADLVHLDALLLSYLVDLVHLDALLLSYLVDLVNLDALLLGCLDVKHLLPDQALTRQDLTV